MEEPTFTLLQLSPPQVNATNQGGSSANWIANQTIPTGEWRLEYKAGAAVCTETKLEKVTCNVNAGYTADNNGWCVCDANRGYEEKDGVCVNTLACSEEAMSVKLANADDGDCMATLKVGSSCNPVCKAGYARTSSGLSCGAGSVLSGGCEPCAGGKVCPQGTVTGSEQLCPAGYYCDVGTSPSTKFNAPCEARFFCPAGTSKAGRRDNLSLLATTATSTTRPLQRALRPEQHTQRCPEHMLMRVRRTTLGALRAHTTPTLTE